MAEVDVAIVGGGPAGLAAAIELRGRGVSRVVVLEREAEAGGVPRHCSHSPFGMREFLRVLPGPAYAERLRQAAMAAGVDIRTGTTVTNLREGGALALATPAGPSAIAAGRVLLATGVRETPRSARLTTGDRPIGVITTGTLQQAVHFERLRPFLRPIIVGTELVSLSAVLTCRAAGIKPVAIVEKHPTPTVRRPLALFPSLLGIKVHYGTEIVDIRGGPRVSSVVLRLADGGVEELACDGVLFTGGFVPEASLVRQSHLALDEGSSGPVIDQYGRCSDPFFFAAGNVLRGVETAGWSYREGRRIGACIAEDLAGRLPVAASPVAIERDEDIKLIVPQRLVLPLAPALQGLPALQLRAVRRAAGRLRVKQGAATLWERRIGMAPERRILIGLADLAGLSGQGNLVVDFTEE